MDWLPDLIRAITELVKEVGFTNGLFIVFFVLAHILIFSMYRGRINDRQADIDRLAAENREYRTRFLRFLDNKHDNGDSNDN